MPAPHHTYRRRGLATHDTYNRIDRWYRLHDEVVGRLLSCVAGVVGSLAAADPPNDPLPIILTISTSDKGPSRKRRLHAHIVSPGPYLATLARKLEMLLLHGSPTRRLGAVVVAAHSPARITEVALLRDASAGPRLLAEAALRCATPAPCGHHQATRSMCDVLPRVARHVDGDTIDVKGLADFYRRNMESAILADIASLPRSKLRDIHKRGRATQLRKHHDAIRAQGRRINASALYYEDNSPCISNDDAPARRRGGPALPALLYGPRLDNRLAMGARHASWSRRGCK